MYQPRPFVVDTNAVISIHREGHLSRIELLVENTLVQWPPGVAEELTRRESALKQWVQNHRGETELSEEEQVLVRELTERFGKPFQHGGRTRKVLHEADAEAVAIAVAREWCMVTDDKSAQIVCGLYGGTWVDTGSFLSQLEFTGS